jgi:ABC-type polysaccharide/polyol phosphate transport system ATPase subunit
MSASPRLEVEEVVKRYWRGRAAYGSLRDTLAGLFVGRRARGVPVEALDGVSLAVAAGEMLAVVGSNGAGKTTLLKVIARITPPDAGRVVVRGRLSALIEVGAGFHPELTGRENVMLHGSILGLSRRFVRQRMDAIAAFAGLADALDTPVKHFSTGMYARLGFSVAVHAEPQLLLVDEVLSVGDEAFRERCYARIDALRQGGTALLFVSHDLDAVARHADRAVWLHAGRIRAAGDPQAVLDRYRRHAASETDAAARGTTA